MDATVLVVDDEYRMRKLVGDFLRKAGFSVMEAEDGAMALALLSSHISLVILDVMMPGMDGWDTIRAILDNNLEQGIAIVMLTAKNAPDTKMIGLQEYVVDYITKPFDNEDLIEKTTFIMGFVQDHASIGTSTE